jgi:2-methylisocitrate lyase-like PEP mutase family enzyme
LQRTQGYKHTCVSLDEAIAKYRAAVAARDSVDPSMVICARCTVLQTEGGTLDDAIARATSYVREAGVDFIYLDNVRTRDAVREVCQRIPCPVLPSYSGPPPLPSFAEWTELGAAVVSNAGSTTRVAVQAVWEFLHELHERGPVVYAEWNDRARAGRWGDASAQMSKATAGDDLRAAERFLPD